MTETIVGKNRERDVFLTDGVKCWFLPKGWCDQWGVAAGNTGGLNYIDDDGSPCPEIYCYALQFNNPNAQADTDFVSVEYLEKLREVTEEEAYRIVR